jgi:hypothetical protein
MQLHLMNQQPHETKPCFFKATLSSFSHLFSSSLKHFDSCKHTLRTVSRIFLSDLRKSHLISSAIDVGVGAGVLWTDLEQVQ